MWASLLSSAGALVELQAPCLTDTVLVQVVDYIYTGALPLDHDQQECSTLLTAASYLQMDGLLETLRSKVKSADNASSSTARRESQSCKLDSSAQANMEDMCQQLSSTCSVKSPERESQHREDISVCGGSERHICENADLNVSSFTTGECRQMHNQTPCDLIQSISSTTGWYRASGGDNEVWEDRFHSADSWQMRRDELAQKAESLDVLLGGKVQEGERSKEDSTLPRCLRETRNSKDMKRTRQNQDAVQQSDQHHFSTLHLGDSFPTSSRLFRSSSTSSHPCSGAVPVIRHSSTASAAVSALPSQHCPVTQSSVGCCKASPSGSTDNDQIAEGINKDKLKNQPVAQNWDNVNKQDERCCDIEALTQTAEQDASYKPNRHDYNCCSRDVDRHWDKLGITGDHVDHCDSFQNRTRHFRTDLMAPNKDEQLHCSDCHNILMVTVTENQSAHTPDTQSAVPLPLQETGTGSVSHCEEFGPEREVIKKLSDLLHRSPSDSNAQHSQCHRFGAWNEWNANLHSAEKSFSSSVYVKHADVDVDAAVSTDTVRLSSEHENISEQSSNFPMSVDKRSDVDPGFVGHSYHGHLHYHCLSQEDPHSHPQHPFSPHKPSSQSGDEHEAGLIPHQALSPLRQYLASAERVVLLDISTKPAELLVSYTSNKTEAFLEFSQKDTSGNGLENTAGEPTGQGAEGQNEAAGSRNSENGPIALTVCSSPAVPDYVDASISPTLSVCMPSAMPVSVPTNVSEQLSAPLHHPFQCSMCERSFSQRGSLNRHMRSHLGIRPFPCPRCPMTFSRQYRVTEHMRVHQRFVPERDFPKPSAPPI